MQKQFAGKYASNYWQNYGALFITSQFPPEPNTPLFSDMTRSPISGKSFINIRSATPH
jgi:hypothetical protein